VLTRVAPDVAADDAPEDRDTAPLAPSAELPDASVRRPEAELLAVTTVTDPL
jgi:hypothetical protein